MRVYYFLVVTLFVYKSGYAQEGGSIPSVSIPKTEIKIPDKTTNTSEYSLAKPFVPTRFKTAAKTYSTLEIDKPRVFNPPVSDLNPGKINAIKLNKSLAGVENTDSKLYRRNMFLGDFKTNSESVGIFYRDFGLVDGDLIRILVNDKIVVYEIYLEGDFHQLNLKLEKGINKIDFEALSEGTSVTNTAEFKIFNDKGILLSENQWDLGTGFKATVILIKEE